MDASAVDRIVSALRAGQPHRVPFYTTLFAEADARDSVVCACEGGGFELTTTFREHAPGPGWSIEQHETEPRTEAQLREELRSCDEATVTPR